jgi:hypothetical protein
LRGENHRDEQLERIGEMERKLWRRVFLKQKRGIFAASAMLDTLNAIFALRGHRRASARSPRSN